VGFAGAGAISRFHLEGWRAMPDAEVVAICDPDAARAGAMAAMFGIRRIYPGLRQLLDDEALDAVEIATPVGTHAELVRLAADRGVHVCCQKPLTPTVGEAEALVAYVGDRVRFMVHENYRFRPHYVQIGEWLRTGRIGRVLHARMIVRAQGMIEVDGVAPFLLERQPYLKDFGRLLVFEVLIHHLDVLRALLGPLEVVSAQLARTSPAVRGEDLAILSLAGADGLTAVVDGNISAPGYPPLPTDRLEIIGTRGTLVFDHDRLYQVGSTALPIRHDLERNYQACFTAAIWAFVEGLRSGRPFPTDRLDNLETLKLMENCYRAAGVEP
jgi:D-apiose dehydrogenase